MQIAAVKALPSLGLQHSSLFGDGRLPNFALSSAKDAKPAVTRASYNWPRPPPGYQEPQPGEQQGPPSYQQQQQQGPQQQGPPSYSYHQQQQQGPPSYQQQGPPSYQQQGPPTFRQQGPPQSGFQQQQGPPQSGFQPQQGPPPGSFQGSYQQQGPPPGSFQGSYQQQGPPPGFNQQQGPPQVQGPSQNYFQPQQQGPPQNNYQQQHIPPHNFQQSNPLGNNFQQNGSFDFQQTGAQPPVDEFPSGASSSFASSTLPTRPLDSRPKFRSRNNNSGLSGSLGLNFPGSQIPGLPGSPRPKPGTPRPYDPTKQKSKVMEWLTPPKPPTELLQREHFKLSDTCSCTIFFGDLSKWTVDGKSDAVIAPANKKLNTGPAVNAVLFKAAGSKMLECTQRIPDIAPQGIKAEMGDAISTRAFDLPVHRVIHTVGSVFKKNAQTGVRESDALLEKAYKTALMVARKENLKYLAFPPLSCNIYGYPYSDGAEVAIKTLKENCEGFLQIDIVIRNIEGYEAFVDEAHKVLEPVKEKKTLKVRIGDDGSVVSGTVIETTNAIPNSPYARTTAPRIDPSLPPAAAEKAAAMAAAVNEVNEAREAAEAAMPPGAMEYVAPPQKAPESAPVPARERASPIPPTGPPPTPPSTPTMSYPTQYYQK